MSNAYHAEQLARQWHHGQMRKDGKTPYITHPEAAALCRGLMAALESIGEPLPGVRP